MQIKAIVAAAKTPTPILPSKFPLKYEYMPNIAKFKARRPQANSPTLKIIPVTPCITPKSLRALFIQLNWRWVAIAIMMQMNAKMGAIIPLAAPILCRLFALESDNPLIPQQP